MCILWPCLSISSIVTPVFPCLYSFHFSSGAFTRLTRKERIDPPCEIISAVLFSCIILWMKFVILFVTSVPLSPFSGLNWYLCFPAFCASSSSVPYGFPS